MLVVQGVAAGVALQVGSRGGQLVSELLHQPHQPPVAPVSAGGGARAGAALWARRTGEAARVPLVVLLRVRGARRTVSGAGGLLVPGGTAVQAGRPGREAGRSATGLRFLPALGKPRCKLYREYTSTNLETGGSDSIRSAFVTPWSMYWHRRWTLCIINNFSLGNVCVEQPGSPSLLFLPRSLLVRGLGRSCDILHICHHVD